MPQRGSQSRERQYQYHQLVTKIAHQYTRSIAVHEGRKSDINSAQVAWIKKFAKRWSLE
jgi:hypothetical protein